MPQIDTITPIRNLSDFILAVTSIPAKSEYEYFYRGHADSTYKLLPNIYRKDSGFSSKEHLIIKEAILRNPHDFSSKITNFEKLALMQHYEFPTRLLDLTENPLVALYFACKGKETKDGEVILFKIKKDYVKYFDSDTVSILSAIAKISPDKFKSFNDEIKEAVKNHTSPLLKTIKARLSKNSAQSAVTTLTYYVKSSIKPETRKIIVDIFNECSMISYLTYEVQNEKPHFKAKIEPEHFNNSIVCVKSKYDNQRIAAQQGAFLLFGIKDSDKNKCAEFEKNGIDIERFNIDKSIKKELLKQLSRFGISDERMFPELMSSARVLKEKYKYGN